MTTSQNASGDRQKVAKPWTLARRDFLKFIGGGTAAATLGGLPLLQTGCGRGTQQPQEPKGRAWVAADGSPTWNPVEPPLPTAIDSAPPETDAGRLAGYQIIDDLVLPNGYRYVQVAAWGEVFGDSEHRVPFGFNCDYTGLLPIPGSHNEFWLMVNHEDLSACPWFQGYAAAKGHPLPDLRSVPGEAGEPDKVYLNGQFIGNRKVDLSQRIPPGIRALLKEIGVAGLEDLGISIWHVRRADDGRFEIIADSAHHRRIHGLGRINVDESQAGPMAITGPAALWIDTAPPGTFGNCSGGTTPWGTFLTCEENIQNHTSEFVAPDGSMPTNADQIMVVSLDRASRDFENLDDEAKAAGFTPNYLGGLGYMLDRPLDSRHFGWVCEIEPRTGGLKKHSLLGRFRHENVGLRCEAGKPLAAYMGDDRRGGHFWKFVSRDRVEDPADPANSKLFERGDLYVARFNPDQTGDWIRLHPDSPLQLPDLQHFAKGLVSLPKRPGGGAVSVAADAVADERISVEAWRQSIEAYSGKPFDRARLGDLVDVADGVGIADDRREEARFGVILMDAFLMANAVGGTPTARPEDVEVHPSDGAVFIAFTSSTGGGEGWPDTRIFPDSRETNSRQYGAIYRVEEKNGDPAAMAFTWRNFVNSGEVAEGGGGFASPDNLTFDPMGNLWFVTDISSRWANREVADRAQEDAKPGGNGFQGVFGNSAMFMVPTTGPRAGLAHCFALGPTECELTGITFSPDGLTLLVSVQHPGEFCGTRSSARPSEKRRFQLSGRDKRIFTQERDVPIGSNFPSGRLDEPPRPTLVCIIRDPAS